MQQDADATHRDAVAPGGERRFRHRLEGGFSNCVIGWLYDPAQPERRLSVRLVLERRDRPPQDLVILPAQDDHHIEEFNGRKVACGFVYRIPLQPDAVKVRAFELTTNTELDGSPLHLGVMPYFEGFLDGVVDGQITGWAWANRSDYNCDIDLYIDGEYVATAFAVDPRPDLPDGVATNVGFRHPIPARFLDNDEHEVAAIYHGTTEHLHLSPQRIRLALPDRVAATELHAALGSDKMLRGTFRPAVGTATPPDVDLLVDGRLLTSLPTHYESSADAGRTCEFAVPSPCLDGSLDIAIAGSAARHAVDIMPPATARPTALDCRHVTTAEQALLARLAADAERPDRQSKLLLPVWGDSYISHFCELCLPSLLSANNLPKYAQAHPLEFIILTRSTDFPLFDGQPSVEALQRLVPVRFIAIDDILAEYFDPRPRDIYALALTHAYFRGIKACGADVTATDFIFWNGDFIAADGTFATLGEIVTKGGRCTMAASIRADLSARDALVSRLHDKGARLEVQPHELVQIALTHPHPTVEAQTLNRFPDRTMDNIKQFFWQVGDDVAIARFFVLFMLHIRPEQLWDDISGFCDYAFVPEMVPNGEIVFETNSDRICIFELQDREREPQWIRTAPLDRDAVARSIDYWATEEHVEASRQLVIFNGRAEPVAERTEIAAAASQLDDFMNDLYIRMGGTRQWHNEHIYWRLCFRVLETPTPLPPPDRPRSQLGNLFRWTGYDLDSLVEGWRGGRVLLENRLAARPKPGRPETGDTAEWLDDLFNTYLSAWRWEPSIRLVDLNPVSFVDVIRQTQRHPEYDDPHWMVQYSFDFTGVRWGLVEQHDGVWYRLLGPGGGSVLLHRTTQRDSFRIELCGRTFGSRRPQDLVVLVNDEPPSSRLDRVDGERFAIRIYVSQDRIIDWEGRLVITLVDRAGSTANGHAGFGFTEYRIQPYGWIDAELEYLADVRLPHGKAVDLTSALWDRGSNLIWPTLSRLSETPAPVSGEDIVIDVGERIAGAGWKQPFSYRGVRYRWVEGRGGEVVVARLTPGTAYEAIFVADRGLSAAALVAAAAITVNDIALSDVRVALVAGDYHISARLPARYGEAYQGWVAVRLVVDPQAQGQGGGRIDLAEPDDGGIAVRLLRLSASSETAPQLSAASATSEHAVAPIGRGGSVGDFWQAQVADWLLARTADAGQRERACQLLASDAEWYAAKVRHYGGRVLASWVCCPADARHDAAVASAWLGCVDRQIGRAWQAAEGDANAGPFRAGADELVGAGFGGVTSICGQSGRLVLPKHPTRLFLRLSREQSWVVELEFCVDAERVRPDLLQVTLEDDGGVGPVPSRPVGPQSVSIAGESITLAVAVSREFLTRSHDSVTVKIVHTSDAATPERIALLGLRAAIAGDAARVPHKSPHLLNVAATVLDLDPACYVAALERSDPYLLDSLLDADRDEVSPDLARTLVAYCDYEIARKLRLQTVWQENRSEIDLRRPFDGVGWSHVDSLAGRTGRKVGLAGAATIFFQAPAHGAIDLTLDCVGKFVPLKLGQISLMLNGEPVAGRIVAINEHAGRISLTFDAASLEATGGVGALRVAVDATLRPVVGFRSLGLQWTPAAGADGPADADGKIGSAALAAAAGFTLPTQAVDVDRIPGLPAQDLLIARFGRDPALYRAWLEITGTPLERVFASGVPGERYPSPAALKWLDLVDRTFVEGLIAAPPAGGRPLCPVLRSAYPWGWGPLTRQAGTLVRPLSGAGDGMLFIPPQFGATYTVELRFADDVDRQQLLALKVTANRRSPETALSFDKTGAILRITIDPAIADFGDGWVALRLYLDGVGDNESGISFWQPRAVPPASPIAVRHLRIMPVAAPPATAAQPMTSGINGANGAARQTELPAAIHCVVPVWGAEYLKTFLEIALPSHLAAGNLPALRGIRTIYEIYSDEVGRRLITQHPLYGTLQAAVDEVVFTDIRSFRYEEHAYHSFHLLLLNYSIMNKCHQTSIARATAHDGALLFLNCDTVYSDGTFARFRQLCEHGYRVIENLSIRTDRDEIMPVLMQRRGPDGVLSIASGELTRLALPRLHWIAKGQFWHGSRGLSTPNNIHWLVTENAVLLRSTHFMPLYVFPRAQDVRFTGTIDHGFVPTAGIADSERWLMADAEEPSSYELSLSAHDQRFNAYERGSVRDHARFLSQLCENVHLQNLERSVRIAAEPVAEERWRQVEHESAEILVAIRKTLQKYVLTPWRPDSATEPDNCAVVWSPGLSGHCAPKPVVFPPEREAAVALPPVSGAPPPSHAAAESDIDAMTAP